MAVTLSRSWASVAPTLSLRAGEGQTEDVLQAFDEDGFETFRLYPDAGAIRLRMSADENQNPGLHIEGYNGGWTFEMDSAATVPFNDLAIAKKLSSIQTITPPGSGNHTWTFNSQTTGPIAFDASGATAQAAFEALSTVGSGNVRVKKSGANFVVIFTGTKAFAAQNAITVSAGSVAQTVTGGGVNDVWYVSNNDEAPPSFAIGGAQPDTSYRNTVNAPGTSYPSMGGLRVPFVTGQTANTAYFGGIVAGGGLTVDALDRVTVKNTQALAFRVLTAGDVETLKIDTSGSGHVKSVAGTYSFGPAAGDTAANTFVLATASTSNCSLQVRTASWGSFRVFANGSSPGDVVLETTNGTAMTLGTNGGAKIRVKTAANSTTPSDVIVGGAAMATPVEIADNATAGFLHIPSVSGTPSGTPTTLTGGVPICFSRTDNKIYVYDGAWIGTAALS